jgi:thioredoxin-like negative regulator of GroEL
MADLVANKIKTADAIKILDDLRVVWRGDLFEYNLLYQLGDLYAKSKNEVQTLRIYKEMLSNFPRFPKNEEVASKMQDLFNTAMERSLSKKENIFEAVTIYYEFEELKPVGEKGDEVTIQLAEALTKFDLLSDAAKLLSKYADTKKEDADKAEIETRVAVLYFLNNKFKEASDVLQKTYDENQMPKYLVQERQILLARSLIELGDYPGANAVISKLPAEMFFRFKTDIMWKQKKWKELIDSYKYVTDKTEDDLMKLAVANALTGNDEALDSMRKVYSDKMKKSQYADNFNFITDTSNLDYRNLAVSLNLPDTEKLIASYKKKIQSDGLASVAANPDNSKPSAGEKPAAAAKPEEQKPQTPENIPAKKE